MGKINIPTQTPSQPAASREPADVGVQINDTSAIDAATESVRASVLGDDSNDGFDLEMQLLPLKRHFDIDINNTEQNKDLEWIMAWGKMNGVWGRNKLMERIREIEFRIGADTFGPSRASAIANYLKMEMQARETIGRLRRMEQNGAKG